VDAAAGVAADRSTTRFTTALAPAAMTNTAMRANTMTIGDIVGGDDGIFRGSASEGVGFEIGRFAAGRLCVVGENDGDDRGSATDNLADVCGAKRRISSASGESGPAATGAVLATTAPKDNVAGPSTWWLDAGSVVAGGTTTTGRANVDWSSSPLSCESWGGVGTVVGGCGGLVSFFIASVGVTVERPRSEERRRTT